MLRSSVHQCAVALHECSRTRIDRKATDAGDDDSCFWGLVMPKVEFFVQWISAAPRHCVAPSLRMRASKILRSGCTRSSWERCQTSGPFVRVATQLAHETRFLVRCHRLPHPYRLLRVRRRKHGRGRQLVFERRLPLHGWDDLHRWNGTWDGARSWTGLRRRHRLRRLSRNRWRGSVDGRFFGSR